VKNYETMFGEIPREYRAPAAKDYHPELDSSALCNEDDTAKFESLIGALQWTISRCRFDIAVAVMTLGRYRAAPRKGHLEGAKHICGYLRKYSHGAIRFRVGIPDHSGTAMKQLVIHDWMYSVYGSISEELPRNLPEPKGKPVRVTSFVDANLYHDYVTGHAVTVVLHFFNGTPTDWLSKRQNTVESATYGSEFQAARTATD
jgi:hypothetical protein